MASEQKDWIFISDAHFTGKEPEEVESFLGFLDAEEERIDHLVILGDLFEFFFGFKDPSAGNKSFGFSDYLPVLEKLRRLDRQGVRITYFEGNHDFSLQSFFSEQWKMKVEVHPEGAEERLEILNRKEGAWGCRTLWKCTEVCPKEIPVTKQIGQIKKRIYEAKHSK